MTLGSRCQSGPPVKLKNVRAIVAEKYVGKKPPTTPSIYRYPAQAVATARGWERWYVRKKGKDDGKAIPVADTAEPRLC